MRPISKVVGPQIEDANARLHAALTEIYAYHRYTEVMSARAAIDIPQIPTLREVLAPMFAYWGQVRELLVAPWRGESRNEHLIEVAIGHAIAFTTWQSLVREQGLDDAEAVELMEKLVRCAARA